MLPRSNLFRLAPPVICTLTKVGTVPPELIFALKGVWVSVVEALFSCRSDHLCLPHSRRFTIAAAPGCLHKSI